ncbi:MAG: GspH/FimT family pseudopilin, partial [Candidatus Sedimenticola sp. 6PFRAG1]
IELMVTVVVLVIVMMIGVPSILQLKRNNQLVTNTNSIVTALNFAKSEAVKQGLPVRVQQLVVGEWDWPKGWNVLLPDGTVFRTYKGWVDPAAAPINLDTTEDPVLGVDGESNATVTFEALGNANATCFDVKVLLRSDPARIFINRSVTVNNMGRISTCRDTCAAVAGDPTLCH